MALDWFAPQHRIPLAHQLAETCRGIRLDAGLAAELEVADVEPASQGPASCQCRRAWRGSVTRRIWLARITQAGYFGTLLLATRSASLWNIFGTAAKL